MSRWKKVFLALLVLVVLSQLPFVYRRYKLGKLHAAIQSVNSQRSVVQSNDESEYAGVVHVHSFLGGHSEGHFDEIIASAKSNQLAFVVMTEHPAAHFNTAAMTLKGVHDGILFVNGNEISSATSERLLILPGDESTNAQPSLPTTELIRTAKAKGARVFVAYPQEFNSWNASDYDGIEIYNVYTNAQKINPVTMFFDGLWSYRSYPDLLFARFYSRPTDALMRWDQLISNGRRVAAVAGNDAHANIGVQVIDSGGKRWLGIQLDPYDRSFRFVRMHVLVPGQQELTPAALLEALAEGHCFIGFDLFGDTSGFRFSAFQGDEKKVQGDEITLGNEVRLEVVSPVPGRIVLYRSGVPVLDESGVNRKEYVVREKGAYRVEVYLPQLPKPAGEQPWIISNPIYVR
jgi:hypothetical protein